MTSARLIVRTAVLGAALVLALLPGIAEGQAAPIRIVIETTDDGLRCVEGCDAVEYPAGPWQPVLDVPLGSLVELTFVWAHESKPLEEHIMQIEGYRLETSAIDAQNRSSTIRFIADQPGSFVTKCTLDCDLHDSMQRTTLRVRRTGGFSAEYMGTDLHLAAGASQAMANTSVPIEAHLQDLEGNAVARAEIQFFVATDFAGVRDLVLLGTARTDEDGFARFGFTPLTDEPLQYVVARFAGMGIYDEVENDVVLQFAGRPPVAYEAEPTGFEIVRGYGRLGAVIAFIGVWATLGFVLLLAVRISRAGGAEGDQTV